MVLPNEFYYRGPSCIEVVEDSLPATLTRFKGLNGESTTLGCFDTMKNGRIH